jgi:hypothetical protein
MSFEATLVELHSIFLSLSRENEELHKRCLALEELVRKAQALLEGVDTSAQQTRYEAWRRQVDAL